MLKSEKIKSEFTLILSAILLLILSGMFVFWFSVRSFFSQAPAPQIIGKAALTIDFGNGEKRVFEGEIINSENLIDTLNQAAKAGNFSYRLDEKNNLAAIEKFSSDGKKFWKWYLNGQEISKLLNEIVIKDGDNILVKYE